MRTLIEAAILFLVIPTYQPTSNNEPAVYTVVIDIAALFLTCKQETIFEKRLLLLLSGGCQLYWRRVWTAQI